MIPRLKPFLGFEEAASLLKVGGDEVSQFEKEFAQTFEAAEAIAFPYGRSALWAFFKAVGLKNTEIIMPAYTCSVVAHAIVLSGNIPRFVDITLHDYNMDLAQVEAAINEQTRAIVATHLFGYPLNIDELDRIVKAAEAKYGHNIWVVQDCAHSFGAKWNGHLVCNAGDVALFGLNISKTITSIFGGMLTTCNLELAGQLRDWREAHFNTPNIFKSLYRRAYLAAIYPAFNETLYGFVHWLQENTPILNRLTRAYHLDEKIHFPPDYLDKMLAVEAKVGRIQLKKYTQIVNQRQKHAHFYAEHLPRPAGWVLPPLIEGATYSHYVIRVPDQNKELKTFTKNGIQLGQLIEYSIPEIPAYTRYREGQEFPNSLLCSRHVINLPLYVGLSSKQQELMVRAVQLRLDELSKSE